MKLPKNYVAEAGGVVKPTAYGGVGQKLMESMGWRRGQGLGKDGAGLREALDVKEKKDNRGVGASGASWNWTNKFWEDAYNNVISNIGTASDDSDSSSSSSEDEEAACHKRAHKRTCQGKEPKAKAGKVKAKEGNGKSAVSPSTSSATDTTASCGHADKEVIGAGQRAPSKSPDVALHRDGTLAVSASQEELAIMEQLSRDPWGRWGGKAGKMARIRQQEAADATLARQRLGLAVPQSTQAPQGGSGDAGAGGQPQGREAGRAAQPVDGQAASVKPRIVVTLSIKEDLSLKRHAFKPTPATGWWGAGQFVSAGPLESLEQAAEHTQRERRTFNEDDQAMLYMKAHNSKREGHKGLGKSEKVKVAGGWQGQKQTFAESEDEQGEQDGGPEAGAGPGSAAVQAEAAAEQASLQSKANRVKWLKVVRGMLRQAPGSRIKVKRLCRQLLEHVREHHGPGVTLALIDGSQQEREGSPKLKRKHIQELLEKKAKKKKVVIEGSYVILPSS